MSKSGFKGLGIVIVAMTASVYGAKSSTGILVPLFIIGDILAVVWFKKHVKKEHLLRFLPAMMLGVVVAVFVGNDWDETVFKKWMSVIILGSTAYMFWTEFRKVKVNTKSPVVGGITGFAAGFTTMVGNLAGPFANLYFLLTGLPKKEIIGTAAWVFFIINIFKVPFHIFSWQTINATTLEINLMLAPAVLVGFFLGLRGIHLFSEKGYRRFLLFVTALGALLILF